MPAGLTEQPRAIRWWPRLTPGVDMGARGPDGPEGAGPPKELDQDAGQLAMDDVGTGFELGQALAAEDMRRLGVICFSTPSPEITLKMICAGLG